MKKLILLLLFVFIVLLLGFILFSGSVISIQWLDWNIHVDAFFLFLFWISGYILLMLLLTIYRIPRRIKTFVQKYKTSKSTSQFNKALLAYLNDDFDLSLDYFALVKDNENYFEAQLMSAIALIKMGEMTKTTAIMRKLMKQYPEQGTVLQCLLGKWQLKIGEYHLAYETLASEIKQSSPLVEKWFLFMQATEHTQRLDEWQLLLPEAKKELSRQDFRRLCHRLYALQIKHAQTPSQLKSIWEGIDHAAKQQPILIKNYLDRCDQLKIVVDDQLSKIKQILKQQWQSQWLWDMVNYLKVNDYHHLLDWCKGMVKQHHHAEDCAYFLSLSVIACRAQLWAISEDFLIQANKSLNKNEHDQITITLIRGWINDKIEQQEVPKQWADLMARHGMNWAIEN